MDVRGNCYVSNVYTDNKLWYAVVNGNSVAFGVINENDDIALVAINAVKLFYPRLNGEQIDKQAELVIARAERANAVRKMFDAQNALAIAKQNKYDLTQFYLDHAQASMNLSTKTKRVFELDILDYD